MGSLTETECYFAAHCALLFATSIVAIIITFALVFLARRRKDPARGCMTLVKLTAVFFILSDTNQKQQRFYPLLKKTPN